jgi:hypothetical protein
VNWLCLGDLLLVLESVNLLVDLLHEIVHVDPATRSGAGAVRVRYNVVPVEVAVDRVSKKN